MISWKYSFKKISEEYALTMKKKDALDKLFEEGKISQPTYDWFKKEITGTLEEIEAHRKELMEKMNTKISELQQQIKTLEIFLANLEIQRATGELSGVVYEKQIESLTAGIDAAKQELDSLTKAVDELSVKTELKIKESFAPMESIENQPCGEKTKELEETTTEQFSIEENVEEPGTLTETFTTEEEELREKTKFQMGITEEETEEPSTLEKEEETVS